MCFHTAHEEEYEEKQEEINLVVGKETWMREPAYDNGFAERAADGIFDAYYANGKSCMHTVSLVASSFS